MPVSYLLQYLVWRPPYLAVGVYVLDFESIWRIQMPLCYTIGWHAIGRGDTRTQTLTYATFHAMQLWTSDKLNDRRGLLIKRDPSFPSWRSCRKVRI